MTYLLTRLLVVLLLLWLFLLAPLITPSARAEGPSTKLGIGLYLESHAARDAIFEMRPPLVLLQDPTDKLPLEIKTKLPQTLIIGRLSVEDTMTPEGAVRYADTIHTKYAPLKGVITAWTFYNEPSVQAPGEAEQFDRAQAAFARRMHEHGWGVVGFNFGVGVLEPGDYARLFPQSLPLVDYIGVHAYGSEKDFFMQGPDRDYYALRYRKIRAATLAAGYDKPFILTESGTWSGWKGRASVNDVVRDYLWFEDEIARDDYVLGQIPFLLDGFNWEGFKLLDTSAVPAFTSANQGKSPARYATRTPTPTATPTPVATATPATTATPSIKTAAPASLDMARQYIDWLREVMKLPPELRALAIKRGAEILGVSPLTIYEWLTWLEISGELGPLTMPPTATLSPTETPTATVASTATATPTVTVTPMPTLTSMPTTTPRPWVTITPSYGPVQPASPYATPPSLMERVPSTFLAPQPTPTEYEGRRGGLR